MSDKQQSTYTCERCGRTGPVTRVSSHEFEAQCECGYWASWSWAHDKPAPLFVEPAQARLPLRSEGSEP